MAVKAANESKIEVDKTKLGLDLFHDGLRNIEEEIKDCEKMNSYSRKYYSSTQENVMLARTFDLWISKSIENIKVCRMQ